MLIFPQAFRSLAFCAALLAAFSVAFAAAPGRTAAKAAEPRNVLYTCACGATCPRGKPSTRAGRCSCGKPLKWSHVVKVEGSVALVCSCAKGCRCKLDPKDATQCGCGHAVARVELKGSELYFCNCGGSCTCNTVSDKPGQCGCGMALKQAK